MAGSLYYFGLAGAVLGGILALVGLGTDALALGGAGNVLVISLLIILTGGLHLDGLADTADGIFSGRPREQKLEIMRDSRIGVMGVLALWMALTLKVALLGQFAALDKARHAAVYARCWTRCYGAGSRNLSLRQKRGGKGEFCTGCRQRADFGQWCFHYSYSIPPVWSSWSDAFANIVGNSENFI